MKDGLVSVFQSFHRDQQLRNLLGRLTGQNELPLEKGGFEPEQKPALVALIRDMDVLGIYGLCPVPGSFQHTLHSDLQNFYGKWIYADPSRNRHDLAPAYLFCVVKSR